MHNAKDVGVSAWNGSVHISRFGERAEHLHWWFLARPAGMPQLRSSFTEIWDGILPPTPQDVWDQNLARVVEALRQQAATPGG